MMNAFLDKHAEKITGALSCFDRMLFRGYLPIMSGASMAQFLSQEHIRFRDLKSFLLEHAAKLTARAETMAREAQRPYIYLAASGTRKEERAREMAEREGYPRGTGVRVRAGGAVPDFLLSLPAGSPLRE